MNNVRRLVFSLLFATIGFIGIHAVTAALEATVTVDPGIVLIVGEEDVHLLHIEVDTSGSPQDSGWVEFDFHVFGTDITFHESTQFTRGQLLTLDATVNVTPLLRDMCISTGGSLGYYIDLHVEDREVSLPNPLPPMPCTAPVTPNPGLLADLTQVVNCAGLDEITGFTSQVGVSVISNWWNNGQRTVWISPHNGVVFPEGTVTSRTFTDVPCQVTPLAPTLASEQCGWSNDKIMVPTQPDGVEVTQNGPWAANQTWTVTFAPAADTIFPADTQLTYVFTDDQPCPVSADLTPPVVTKVCGPANDVVTPATTQPDGVDPVPVISDWTNGELTLTYSALEGWVLPAGFANVLTVTDANTPCPVSGDLTPPVVTEVCGPANDVVTPAATQPEGVDPVPVINDWTNGERTLTYSALEGWVFPAGFTNVLTVTDANTPCPTDAPVPPVQVAVCGPNNDLVTIPPQPDGVTLKSDSDWVENSRTIEFAVDPAFVTDGQTVFNLTDENTECPPQTTQLIITLQTSDGGSLEGTSYQFYAPTASQAERVPYAEGTVSASNTITIDGLIAGTYRLVTAPEGYESVDASIVVTAANSTQEHVIQVRAIQPVETPTPSPTAEPTVVPTPEPTKAEVSGLPATGSGSGIGFEWVSLAVIVITIMAAGIAGTAKSSLRR